METAKLHEPPVFTCLLSFQILTPLEFIFCRKKNKRQSRPRYMFELLLSLGTVWIILEIWSSLHDWIANITKTIVSPQVGCMSHSSVHKAQMWSVAAGPYLVSQGDTTQYVLSDVETCKNIHRGIFFQPASTSFLLVRMINRAFKKMSFVSTWVSRDVCSLSFLFLF